MRNRNSTLYFLKTNENVPSLLQGVRTRSHSRSFVYVIKLYLYFQLSQSMFEYSIFVNHTFTFPLVLCLSFPPIMAFTLIEPFQNKQPKMINFHIRLNSGKPYWIFNLGPVSTQVKNFPIIPLFHLALAHHTCVVSLECQEGMELDILSF